MKSVAVSSSMAAVLGRLALGAVALGTALTGLRAGEGAAGPLSPGLSCPLADKTVDAYRKELIDFAFETASTMPVPTFRKDKARAQQRVVEDALETGLPSRALELSKKILNWRRGLCFAHVAAYCQENGVELERVAPLLEAADGIRDPHQEWRTNRIKTRMAQVYYEYGQKERAGALAAFIDEEEAARLAYAGAVSGGDEGFQKFLGLLEAARRKGDFNTMGNLLKASPRVYEHYYKDSGKRDALEAKLEEAWVRMPPTFRIETYVGLAKTAAKHGDRAHALKLLQKAESTIAAMSWKTEFELVVKCLVASAAAEIGEKELAREKTDLIWQLFQAKGTKILNSRRDNVLIPLAECHVALGDRPGALKIYKRAMAEAVDCTNSWRRSEDMAAICGSMAVQAVEPDKQLWKAMKEVRKGLWIDGQ
jgi:hypothetical protein